jgi:hypothetical protein
MRAVSGGLLVAAGLFLLYLIISGRLAAGIAAFNAAVGSGTSSTGTSPASATGSVGGSPGTGTTALNPLTVPAVGVPTPLAQAA